MSEREGIVWLASYPKSGNTWTRAFLHNLLHVMQKGESRAPDINAMTEYTTWDIGIRTFSEVMGKDAGQASRSEIAAARPRVQQAICDRTEGLAFVKTHNALVADRGHPTINLAVTSGVIYIVRNPLDVAISFAHHMGASIDEAIRRMETRGFETPVTDKSVFEVYGSWSQHVLSWTRKPNRALYIMRYEDMLRDPEGTFGGLARHLLLIPTADQLRRAIDRSSFDALQKQEAEVGFREKPKSAERFFRKGQMDQWKTELTPAQADRIRSAHHEQMRRFGYLSPEGAAAPAGPSVRRNLRKGAASRSIAARRYARPPAPGRRA